MIPGLWLYAIGRAGHPVPEGVEAIDGSSNLEMIVEGPLSAFVTPVDLRGYSQVAVDAHAGDLAWLGAIGYRHQAVMQALMNGGTVIPLRAFSLFGGRSMVEAQLRSARDQFLAVLDRLEGKQEWTLRIEFEAQRWNEALTSRVASLRSIVEEMNAAAPGKAFLLKKKLDDERKRASRDAETQVVAEIEDEVMRHLACDTVAESRQQRDGAFPQINVLLNRDEEFRLQELHRELSDRYSGEGITLAVTGPWPPYTFASTTNG
ncbi:MAG TPA: GvpL/GvpF family gas vesicle protein [Thermoanaerobaculia bacterium]|nr:GvpL/GvpF family gas vesicle protein [Thermoanaerobaculia bacterium]